MSQEQADPESVPLMLSDDQRETGDTSEDKANSGRSEILTDFEAAKDVVQQSKWLIANRLVRPTHNLVFMGLIGSMNDENMLAGFGLGQTFMDIVFLSTGIKFIQDGACSLISHAYGQKDYRMCQVYRNQAVFVATILFCILLIPSAFARPLFELMGLDEKVIGFGTQYVWITTGFTYFQYVGEVYLIYGQYQEVTWMTFATQATGICAAVLAGALFHWQLGWGFTGIVYAYGIYFVVYFLTSYTLLRCCNAVRQYDDCHLFSRETVSGLLPMLQKGLGGMSLGLLQKWLPDIVQMMVQYAGADAAAGLTVIYRVGSLMLSVALGLMGATGILVGKSVGEENKPRAFQYFRAAMYVACSFTAVSILTVVLLRNQIFGLFTQQEAVLQSVRDLMPVYFTVVAVTSFMNVAYGMVKGTGKQAVSTPISLLACAIGLPWSYCAAFSLDLGIAGLLSGVAVAQSVNAIGFAAVVFWTDWAALFQEVRDRKEKITAKSAGNSHTDLGQDAAQAVQA